MQVTKLSSVQQQSDKIHGLVTVYYFDTESMYESYCIHNDAGEFVDGTFYKDTEPQKQQARLILDWLLSN